MKPAERLELCELLRWNAAKLRLPSVPNTWPDWMTQEKRRSMADTFEGIASHISARLASKVNDPG